VRKKELVKVSKNDPLLKVLRKFTYGTHRAVVMEDSLLVNIISQSDITSYLAKHTSDLELKYVMELNVHTSGLLDMSPKDIVSIDEYASMMEALTVMTENNVEGIAVVSKEGKLLGNISATDIQPLSDASNFKYLNLNALQFMKLVSKHSTPVTCFPTTNLDTVLLRMALNRVHRLYIIGDNSKPIGVLSLTDIMKLCLRHASIIPTSTQ